jgi:hypothetical protein
MEAESVSIAEHAPSVIEERRHSAIAPVVAKALVAATGYAVREMRDQRDPGPAAFRMLLQNIQTRWPILDPDDRAFCAGFAAGVIETQGRLLSRVPTAETAGARQ